MRRYNKCHVAMAVRLDCSVRDGGSDVCKGMKIYNHKDGEINYSRWNGEL